MKADLEAKLFTFPELKMSLRSILEFKQHLVRKRKVLAWETSLELRMLLVWVLNLLMQVVTNCFKLDLTLSGLKTLRLSHTKWSFKVQLVPVKKLY